MMETKRNLPEPKFKSRQHVYLIAGRHTHKGFWKPARIYKRVITEVIPAGTEYPNSVKPNRSTIVVRYKFKYPYDLSAYEEDKLYRTLAEARDALIALEQQTILLAQESIEAIKELPVHNPQF